MTLRVFAVVTLFVIALIFNGVLIVFEHTPEAVALEEKYDVEDRHKDMVWGLGTRRSELQAFNLPGELIEKITARIEAMAVRDRNGDVLKSLMKASDEGGRLCSNSGNLPSRYFVTGLLFEGERGTRRSVVDFNKIRQKLQIQEGFRPVDLEGLYKTSELVPNATEDAFALNIMALLFGEELKRLNQEDDWGDGLFGPPNIRSMLNRRPEVEQDMIEFFAAMYYLHEVARAPQSQFCGVRAGVSFDDGGE